MIRYAVVGAEGYAGQHIKNITEHGPELGCELAAVAIRPADRKPGQLEGFAERGVEVFASAEEMFASTAGREAPSREPLRLADPRVDAVFVPTGIHFHCALTCAALRSGHNVYLEKPPAATVQEIDRMLAAQAESGRICALGFQAISSESIELIKSRVASGALGEVRRLRSWAYWPRHDGYYARNDWAGRLKVGSAWVLDGPAHNALGHEIANMLYLACPEPRRFAAPRSVRAELYHARDITGEDTSAIEILTETGAKAYFIASHCTAGAQTGPWIEMECSAGGVHWHVDGRTEIRYANGRRETLQRDGQSPSLAALANFTQAIRAGDPGMVKCDLSMGRCFTLALNGAYESSLRVHQVLPEAVRRSADDPKGPRTIIEGINEAIARCAEPGALFSDVGVPWAVRTEPFELAGYRQFPVRFRE